mmetsp:Transcript_37558/g.79647  ORF Transcript_37558/g.79647 Transcript_37558/m.79647 type:complete len:225 (+) Transcript_37558:153-827(+)
MSFAALLQKKVSAKKQENKQREAEGQKWIALEEKYIDAAVEIFKSRCIKAAQQMQTNLSVSFEIITRDVPNFPTYAVKNNSYLVENWGLGEPASFWYARKGSVDPFNHGTPIAFADLLEGMMPKFLAKVQEMGFVEAGREAGTWKVKVSWRSPDDDTSASTSASNTNGKRVNGTKSKKDKSVSPPPAKKSRRRSPSKSKSKSKSPSLSRSRSASKTEVPSSDED